MRKFRAKFSIDEVVNKNFKTRVTGELFYILQERCHVCVVTDKHMILDDSQKGGGW